MLKNTAVRRNKSTPQLSPIASAIRTSIIGLGLGLAHNNGYAATVLVTSNLDNGTACTLREAIESFNNGALQGGCSATGSFGSNDTIHFSSASMASSTITLNGSQLYVNSDVSIDGSSYNAYGITIDGDKSSRVFELHESVVSLNNLTIQNGYTDGIGGIGGAINITNSEAAALRGDSITKITNSTITNNTATRFGGAIEITNSYSYIAFPRNRAYLEIINTTITNNQSSQASGGAIFASDYNTFVEITNSSIVGNTAAFSGGGIVAFNIRYLTVTNSIVEDNRAMTSGSGGIFSRSKKTDIINSSISNNYAYQNAGGLFIGDNRSDGSAWDTSTSTISNSTIHGNYSYNSVGGIVTAVSSITINNSTISDNGTVNGSTGNASFTEGSIYSNVDSINVLNSIIAGSNTGTNCENPSGTLSVDDSTIIEDGSCGAVRSGDPYFLSFGDNGGTTNTTLLAGNSPAIDTGDNNTCLVTDQRGFERNDSLCDVGAVEFQRNRIIVDTGLDNPDALVSNDVSGCTLREAIESVNSGGDSLSASYGCSVISNDDAFGFASPEINFTTNFTIKLNGGQLSANSNVLINADTVDNVTIDAQKASRVLYVGGDSVSLNKLTITRGSATDGAGGIEVNTDGISNISNSTVSNNSGETGGIKVVSNMNIVNTTISDNFGTQSSGAIEANGSNAFVNLINSTISTNRGFSSGGIYANSGNISMLNSTVTNNRSTRSNAGNLYAYDSGVINIKNSIITNASVGNFDCVDDYGIVNIDQFSVIEDGSCGATISGDPELGDLTNNGGPTKTHAFNSASIARDSGDNALCPSYDQTGNLRTDGACDLGAVEYDPTDGQNGFNVIPLPNGKVVVIPR